MADSGLQELTRNSPLRMSANDMAISPNVEIPKREIVKDHMNRMNILMEKLAQHTNYFHTFYNFWGC